MRHASRNRRVGVIGAEGFTLVEMLVVTVLLSVVAMATYGLLNNGIRIWHKVNRGLPAEDLNILLDRFTGDLKNTFMFTGMDFSGTKERLEFPVLVDSTRLQKRTVGRVVYAYEPQSRTFDRVQSDFAGVYNGAAGGMRHVHLSQVKSLSFRYYLYDRESQEYLWQEEYGDKTGFPLAVRLELELDDGKEIRRFIKTVDIPVSG